MSVLTHWTKIMPVTAGAVLAGGWVTPAYAVLPSEVPGMIGQPVTTVPLPPPTTINVPNEIPVPPVPPPPFVPVVPPTIPPPPPNGPDEVPPVPPSPPCCDCTPNKPNETPEPATIVSGLIGLGVAGAVRARRRFGSAKK